MSRMANKTTFVLKDAWQRDAVRDAIGRLDLSRPWTVEIRPYVRRRTLSQNNLMWKWCDEIAGYVEAHTGQDKDDIHEWLKRKFLSPHWVEIGGEAFPRYTTTKLTTQEMTDYMDKIHAWATQELGMVLPLPVDLQEDAA